jgi:aminoglycoside phosphotransferase (APT) family kinase protein
MDTIAHDRELWRELIDLDTLAGWMDTVGLGEGAIINASTLGGGTQNVLLKFERSGRTYVLRRPPRRPRPESDETMRREMKVLRALADSAVPHPAFIAGSGDPVVLGAAFYLMESVSGFNPTEALPAHHANDPGVRRKMGMEMVDAAVAMSRIDPDAVGLSGLGHLGGWVERQVPRWRKQLDGYKSFESWTGYEALPDVNAICAWLESNRPQILVPGLIHGDFHLANVMFDHRSSSLAAVVDWELASRGDPLLDLGWLTATWHDPAEEDVAPPVTPWDGFPSIEEIVDRYLAATGRSARDALWYAVLAPFKLGAILEGSHARASAGLTPKAIGDDLHSKTILLFNRALRRIEQEAI